MEYRILNIKGALLDIHQLEDYLRKIASGHLLKDKSDKNTYPIPRLNENFKFIVIMNSRDREVELNFQNTIEKIRSKNGIGYEEYILCEK